MAQEEVNYECDGHCCAVDGCCEQAGACPEHDEIKPPHPWQSWWDKRDWEQEKRKYNVAELKQS